MELLKECDMKPIPCGFPFVLLGGAVGIRTPDPHNAMLRVTSDNQALVRLLP